MSELTIKPASRTSVKPLMGFYSESGCGKTYSALLLARGFVGPAGKICMIDTESGRGSLYADVIQGGYDVLEISEPFTPARAVQAIQAVEKSGAAIGIIDSASHFWEGIGGVLDMAIDNETKSGKAGLHNWRGPKMEHAKFMLRLLQSSIPWVVCLRAKHKSRQGKNAQGKTEIIKDDHTTPIQADDFIFEMTCHGEIMADHTFRLTKCSHPDLRRRMPNNEMVTMEHGKMLAEWCAAPGGSGGKKVKNGDPLKAAKLELWTLLQPVRGTEKDKEIEMAENWLAAEDLLQEGETLKTLTLERCQEIIQAAQEKLMDNLPV
jgi:hypothetical protein